MVTIKDVAKRAGVSYSTASRAIRNIGYVNVETNRRVMEAVDELGYIADQTAQQLKNGTGNLVGIIVSDVNNYFYNMAISSLAAHLKRSGKSVLLAYSNENSEEERDAFKTMLSSKVCSVIFTPVTASNHDLVQRCLDYGISVTQLYRRVYHDVNAVVFDDEESAYIATKHLLDIGCRRPLLIGVSYYNLDSDNVLPNRNTGFLKAIKEYAITEYRCFRHTLLEQTSPLLEELILDFRPDCVISGNNTFTLDLLALMEKHGLSYPEDIKVITFDDFDWCSLLHLSAIHQPIEELVENLIPLLSDTGGARFFRIKSPLILRKSTEK